MGRTRHHNEPLGQLDTIDLWTRLRLGWRLMRDPRVGPMARLVAPALTIMYVLSPIDVVPDFFLGIGQLDDLGVLGLAIIVLTRLLPRFAPAEVLSEHLAGLGVRPNGPESSDPPGDVVDTPFRIKV